MVRSATETKTRDISVDKILQAIRTGGDKLKGQITQIRNRFEAELDITGGDRKKAKLAVDALKKQLPGVTWPGTFTYRANDKLVHHSGLLPADLDLLGEQLPESRNKLQASPHVFALFLSPTGDGLKAIFKVRADASQHQGSYRAVEKHVKDLTGVQIDEKGKDVARLCFMSYDQELYVNEHAIEIEPLPEPEKPKRPQNDGEYPPHLSQRERIATEKLGQLTWSAKKSGYFCQCPGESLHTTLTVGTHTILYLDGSPTIKCQHNSCAKIVEAFNLQLRSLIAKAEYHAKPETSPGEGKSTAEEDNTPDDQAIARLAALSPIEYDRVRKEEAKRLGCRESTLDSRVNAKRLLSRPPDENKLQGQAVQLPNVEPWPEPVNGAEVLNEIAEAFKRYVVLPDVAACVCALWCALTHVFYLFLCSPRLNVRSAEPECGKTTLRDVVGLFVPRPVLTENLTVAVLFRLVNAQKPVILADEYDAWMRENEEMRGLLNAGHRRGAMVYRCEGDGNEVRAFSAYAPAMLCGIGALPGTLHDRSIVIHLERAKSDELKAYFDSQKTQREAELCRKLARWCDDNRERLATANPELPHGVFNRLADNWRPLFTIAKVAGGDWPKRCADACAKLTGRDYEDAESIRTLLLVDIRKILIGEWPLLAEGEEPIPIERIFSKTLVEQLREMAERPWPEARRGKPISEQWLAKQLANFRIYPKTLRIGEERAKGYQAVQFRNAFERYLPPEGDLTRDAVTYEGKRVFRPVTKTENVTGGKMACTEGNVTCHASKGGVPENEGVNEADKQTKPVIDELGVGRL
jgi:putative DNA primase/helicase